MEMECILKVTMKCGISGMLVRQILLYDSFSYKIALFIAVHNTIPYLQNK